MCVYFENVASRSQLVKDRNKDRSRSKSPFRSFRWKKSPQKSPLSAVSASDDEATVEPTSGIVVLNIMRRFPSYIYLLEVLCMVMSCTYNLLYTTISMLWGEKCILKQGNLQSMVSIHYVLF